MLSRDGPACPRHGRIHPQPLYLRLSTCDGVLTGGLHSNLYEQRDEEGLIQSNKRILTECSRLFIPCGCSKHRPPT